jgi:prevent-host-death family protein
MAARKQAAGAARERFADIINEAAYGSTRTVIERYGKPVAAVIPIADLEMLNEIERILDVAEAEGELALAEAEGFDQLTTLEQLLERLGS